MINNLQSKNIVVTRASSQVSLFSRQLKSFGFSVQECPTIDFKPLQKTKSLTRIWKKINSFHYIIFTSVNGVQYFFKYLHQAGIKDIRCPKSLNVLAIGPITAEECREHRWPVHKTSKDYIAESVLEELKNVKEKNILIPRAAVARDILPKTLRQRGAKVTVIPVYKTILPKKSKLKLVQLVDRHKVDCVTFTSSSTVKNFFKLIGKKIKNKIKSDHNICSASIGPITTQTLKKFGWQPRIVAKKPTTQHLAQAIFNHYKKEIMNKSLPKKEKDKYEK